MAAMATPSVLPSLLAPTSVPWMLAASISILMFHSYQFKLFLIIRLMFMLLTWCGPVAKGAPNILALQTARNPIGQLQHYYFSGGGGERGFNGSIKCYAMNVV